MKIGFMGALFLVFLTLKLTEVITWSWWIVTLPLWGVSGIALGMMVFLLLETITIDLFKKKKGGK